MTKIEAIERLEKAKAETTAIAKDIPTTGEYANALITAIELVDALDMAIEALKQEPNEDLISRQDAIDALMRSSVYAWSTEEDQIAHEWVLNIISNLSAKE